MNSGRDIHERYREPRTGTEYTVWVNDHNIGTEYNPFGTGYRFGYRSEAFDHARDLKREYGGSITVHVIETEGTMRLKQGTWHKIETED